ncbi:MAG: multiple sugar transport system permease protein, partial [Pseudonocardiales bacterium]|nr:multiple sugar transport system permease protein [Pseudonocardiales bacterium]
MAAKELTPGQRRFSPASLGADLVLLGWFVFSLFPLVWMVLLALKTNADQITTFFAFTPTLKNFGIVLSDEGTRLTSVNFTDALFNSVINCVGAVLVSL